MTRVAAVLGSSGLPAGSVSEVAAQMPPIRTRVQNGGAIDDVAASATTVEPGRDHEHRHCGVETRGAEHAPVVHATVADAQSHEHAQGRERDRHHRIEQGQRADGQQVDALRAERRYRPSGGARQEPTSPTMHAIARQRRERTRSEPAPVRAPSSAGPSMDGSRAAERVAGSICESSLDGGHEVGVAPRHGDQQALTRIDGGE